MSWKNNRIPSVPQNEPRYVNRSFGSGSNNNSLFSSSIHNVSHASYTNGSNGSSLLYPSKSKKNSSRNSWSHYFSIPIQCGKGENNQRHQPDFALYADPHINKLRTGDNRRIVCGGLQFDIYIHPKQGDAANEFDLSVFPVKTNVDDVLPANYKLKYQVFTSLNPTSSPLQRHGLNDDDQKSVSQFDHNWSRELNDIKSDANPKDITSEHWKWTMERLPFNTNDLMQYAEDDDYFRLCITIKTEYIRITTKRSQYSGILGAILLQSESKLDEQQKQIQKLRDGQDTEIQRLQTSLQEANKRNHSILDNYQTITRQMETMSDALLRFSDNERQIIQQKDREIARLNTEIQDQQKVVTALKVEEAKLRTKLKEHDNNTHAQIAQLQNNQMMEQQATEMLRQQLMNQWQQQQQQKILIQQQQQQNNQQSVPSQRPISNPFSAQLNDNNNNSPQQIQPKLAGQQNYGSFPGTSPQQNTTGMRSSNTMVYDQSPQTTTTHQSQHSSPAYVARIISQPQPMNNSQNMTQPEPATVDNITNSFHEITVQSPSKPALMPAPSPPHEQVNNFSINTTSNNMNMNIPSLEQVDDTKERQEQESKQSELITMDRPEPRSPVPQPPEIEDTVDPDYDDQRFQHRPVRAWRWDDDQTKWRGRGKGQLTIYYNKTTGLAKLVFRDEKHDKTRLLQWINGDSMAHFIENERESNNVPKEENKEEIEWRARDYTMDINNPMLGNWKIAFPDNPDMAQKFIEEFNAQIANQHGTNIQQETSATVPIDDAEEVASNDSTKPFDSNKPFSFQHQEEKPKDSFVGGTDGNLFGGGNTTNWANAFGGDSNNNDDNNGNMFGGTSWSFGGGDNDKNENNQTFDSSNGQNSTSNSFANINWGSNDAQKAEQETKTAEPTQTKASGAVEEDNCAEITFKPIRTDLVEQKVDTGHENEVCLAEIPFLKLYRFGKDVTNKDCWKNRASASKIGFYQNKETGKVRMVAREHETDKLRMNQYVPRPNISTLNARNAKTYQWSAYDNSIANEEENESAGFTQWCVKFESPEIAESFKAKFDEAQQENAKCASPAKPTQQSQQDEKPEDKLVVNQFVINNEENKVSEKQEADDVEEDEYKGWTAEEIAVDKQRKEKAKQDAETAKLFGGGDESSNNQQMSWNMNAFDNSQSGVGGGNAFSFSEDQRGVDLVAEKELNRLGNDASIKFGVTANDDNTDNVQAAAQDFSNVTTRNDTETNNNESGGLGMPNFSFTADNNGDGNNNNDDNKGDEVKKEDDAQAADTGFANTFGSWGSGGGGFSSVQGTDGFANASWGNDNNDGGFGSFGDSANFSWGDMGKKTENQQNEDTSKGETSAAANNDNSNEPDNAAKGGDTDNCAEITFKPIVDLQEVEVESGHENEKKLKSFDFIKLYRWGKDVTNKPCWKNRASNSKLHFYQDINTGKIRIVSRENITSKLRMNQLVNGQHSNLQKKSEKQVGWVAVDTTIAEEDESNGICQFAAKFPDKDIADAFHEFYQTSSENNAQLQ